VVVGAAHATWGEEVVAVLCGEMATEVAMRAAVAATLAAAKRPQRYVWVAAAEWPRDGRGKIARAAMTDLARRAG
jgi:acyl-CoA synthetase (AMP-forming)/AMP-acid ligase II